jgi:GTP-binding protein EngB required for normal cell division
LNQDAIIIFTGRPNAGKSSVISSITKLKPPIGKSPGTTTRFNRYKISKGLSLIDMPGYGVKKDASKKWEGVIKDNILDFIEKNADLIVLAVHVMNISTFLEVEQRLAKKGFISLDIEMVNYVNQSIGEHPLVAANKIDKLNKTELKKNLVSLYDGLKKARQNNVENYVFPVSAKTGEGIGSLKSHIHSILVKKGFLRPFDYLR